MLHVPPAPAFISQFHEVHNAISAVHAGDIFDSTVVQALTKARVTATNDQYSRLGGHESENESLDTLKRLQKFLRRERVLVLDLPKPGPVSASFWKAVCLELFYGRSTPPHLFVPLANWRAGFANRRTFEAPAVLFRLSAVV